MPQLDPQPIAENVPDAPGSTPAAADAEPSLDPVPPSVREILAFFQGELDGQRFGDLDAEALAELAERTRDRAREVDLARAALEAARGALDVAREELGRRAHQALAYARIYASRDPALAERLAALEAGPEPAASERRRGPKRRSGAAPRKAPAEAAGELPFEARAGAA
jgi:multidrug efflux pump subunit AcrA (membrane-fusion protein)